MPPHFDCSVGWGNLPTSYEGFVWKPKTRKLEPPDEYEDDGGKGAEDGDDNGDKDCDDDGDNNGDDDDNADGDEDGDDDGDDDGDKH